MHSLDRDLHLSPYLSHCIKSSTYLYLLDFAIVFHRHNVTFGISYPLGSSISWIVCPLSFFMQAYWNGMSMVPLVPLSSSLTPQKGVEVIFLSAEANREI